MGTATVLDTEVDTVVIALLIVIDPVFLPKCLHLPDSLFRYPKCRIGAGYGSGRGARYESGHGSQCPFNLMVPQVLKFFLACICLTPCSTIQHVQKVTEECAADLFCAHLSSVCENNDESLDSDVTADHQRHVMCVGKGQRPMVIPQRFPHHSGADLGDNMFPPEKNKELINSRGPSKNLHRQHVVAATQDVGQIPQLLEATSQLAAGGIDTAEV